MLKDNLPASSQSGWHICQHPAIQWNEKNISEHTFSWFYVCWCKIIDIIFSLIGIAILLLLLPIVAPLILLDSPGPLFYHQERLGYRGQRFSIHKLRTMRVDAEIAGRAVWARNCDTRVTRVGRFLRATHLDELPQAFNILRGEMSLIGPRPEREEFVVELVKTIPFYRSRLMVKPGLTGWAQVMYRYASTDQEALVKLQYDLYYLRHRSFMLDISILVRTVGEVVCRHGI